jgi:CRP/FNR family cyclic AMP-dependent transcriptional regulator
MSGGLSDHGAAESMRPFFADVDEAALRQAVPSAHIRQMPARTVVVHAQDDSDAFYVILSGRVKVFGTSEDGKEFIFCTIEAGDYFGELVLDGGSRSASVMTLVPCRFLVIPRKHIDELISSYPGFSKELIVKLIRKVRGLTHTTMSLAYEDVYSRFIGYVRDSAVAEGGRQIIPMRPTQSEIAARIGGSREMVSRIITELCAGGYLSVDARHIEIHKRLPARW